MYIYMYISKCIIYETLAKTRGFSISAASPDEPLTVASDPKPPKRLPKIPSKCHPPAWDVSHFSTLVSLEPQVPIPFLKNPMTSRYFQQKKMAR